MTKLILTSAALAVAIPAFAQSPAPRVAPSPPAPPAAKGAVDPLAALLGRWACTGQREETPNHPAARYTAILTVDRDLVGRWYAVRWEEEASVELPDPQRGAGFWSAAAPGKLVGVWVETDGSHWSLASAGWEKDRLAWARTTLGAQAPAREIWTWEAVGQVSRTVEMQTASGWLPIDQGSCRLAMPHPTTSGAPLPPPRKQD